MSEPIFRLAQKDDVPIILEMSRNRAELTELFTSVSVCGEAPYIGSLWVIASEKGEATGVVFDTGTYVIYRSEGAARFIPHPFDLCSLSAAPREKDLIFMEYRSKPRSEKSPSFAESLREIKGKGLADIYRLANLSDTLSDCNEKRYIYNCLCNNKGFSRSFGFFAGDRLISTVSLGARNESHVLISDVFTLPLRRGEGLASALLGIAVETALSMGLVPVLVCEKRLARFYEKEGFCVNGGKL